MRSFKLEASGARDVPEPVTIAAYLVRLNRALVVGLGRRQRILAEMEDHLRTAAAAAVANGATPRQAEASGIAALGAPQEVAATFGRDLLGLVEHVITPIAEAADRLEARRPWLGKLARDWPPSAAVVVVLATVAAAGLITWLQAGLLAAAQMATWPSFPSHNARMTRWVARRSGQLRAPGPDGPYFALDLLPITLLMVGFGSVRGESGWAYFGGMVLLSLSSVLAMGPALVLTLAVRLSLGGDDRYWIEPLNKTLLTTLPIFLLALVPSMPYSIGALAALTALLSVLLVGGAAVGMSRQDRLLATRPTEI